MKIGISFCSRFFLILLLCSSHPLSAAIITQLSDPSLLSLSNNFDNGFRVSNADFTVAEPYVVSKSNSGVGGINPSGARGVFVDKPLPLIGLLSAENYGVGMWFGNDDYNLEFDAILEVFAGSDLLGEVRVAANRNDYADQFIGLSSDMAFDRFHLTYERPQAQRLGIWIDDLYLQRSPIPLPGTLFLVILSLIGLGTVRRCKKAQALRTR